MKELTHKEVSANGGKNRAKNLKAKLGEKGFSDLMKKVSQSRKSKKVISKSVVNESID